MSTRAQPQQHILYATIECTVCKLLTNDEFDELIEGLVVYASECLSLEIHISTEQYECSSLLGCLSITEVDIVPVAIKLRAVIYVPTITVLDSIHGDEMIVSSAQEGT